ncbi:MAG: Crp/Fnr family transcriptional regulator [Moorea sp. SIO4G2]|nr:Crp/Fnr family transcriptional regulator [Moorena sp. SIO4G2]
MNLLKPESLPPALSQGVIFQNLVAEQKLFYQGNSASSFFVVETGRFKIVHYTQSGKMVTLQVVRAGESLAESALFSTVYPYTAIAKVASRVIVYPKQRLLSSLCLYPELAENFMTILVRHIHSLRVRLEWREIRTAHERVLQYLHYLAQFRNQTVLSLDQPFKEIAAELGLTPETVSRALMQLEKTGAITRKRRLITLIEN